MTLQYNSYTDTCIYQVHDLYYMYILHVEYHAVGSFDSISHGFGTEVEIIAEQYYNTTVTCECVYTCFNER